MALKITESINVYGQEVTIPQLVRIDNLEWLTDGTIAVTLRRYNPDTLERIPEAPDLTVHFKEDPQPADPPEDELDPETGEVLVAKGSRRVAIPSVAQLKGMPVPRVLDDSSVGGMSNSLRSNLDGLLKQIKPEWADAEEV